MIFDALAFPWFLYSASGELLESGAGSLFVLPPDATSQPHMDFYGSIRETGWHRCKSGYAVYVRKLLSAESSYGRECQIVMPGLKVRGVSTIQGKSDGLTLTAPGREIISKHLDQVLSSDRKILERFDRVTRENIHEVRGINSGLYHAAIELSTKLPDYLRVEVGLTANIIALSGLLSARIDFVNYLNDDSMLSTNLATVQVYKKFDKMVRCFKPKAEHNDVHITMSGSSFGATFGPSSLMELVAYLLLDNALKYSPKRCPITVEVNDRQSHIEACITSTGPKILDHEIPHIFDMDYRGGEIAKATGKGGSGIGLNVLKTIVEQAFEGQVGVRQREPQTFVQSRDHCDITFFVQFPINRQG